MGVKRKAHAAGAGEKRPRAAAGPAREAASIDDIFGTLGAARAKAAAAPPPAATAGGREAKPRKAAGKRAGKGGAPAEREAPSAFAPPDRAERAGWVDDGLGGVHDREGWTGRKTEEGMRIFKTRLLQPTKKKVSGGTPLCPFDCDCCYV